MPRPLSHVLRLYLRGARAQNRRSLATMLEQPERIQRDTLLRILHANSKTTYGAAHGFDRIRNVREFQDAVPVNSYEDLRPHIAKIADGSDPHALTGDTVEMFTSTSGTTSDPKLIPVTKSGRRAEQRVKKAWLGQLAADHPEVTTGKWFYLFNSAEEARTPSGIWVGSNAGLVYRNTSPLLRRLLPMPYDVCLIEDYATRYYVILRHLLACQISMVACINPSSVLLLAELADQHAESLVRDIYSGGLRDGLALSPEQYAQFNRGLPADPARARELARMRSQDDRLLPRRYWPRLSVVASWKGPGVNSFVEKCRDWYGDIPFRDVGYGSSEFRTGLILSDEGSQNVPVPDTYFYEFIPEDDREAFRSGAKRPLLLHELEQGRRYLIVQTGPHGLYRYDIEDIVEVNGFQRRTPTISFVQKARTVTSITGEKLYESQVVEALERVAIDRRDLKPAFFICFADVEDAKYRLCVEYDEPRSDAQLEELGARFEVALGEVNVEYPYKRASLRLHAPEVHQLARGTSVRFIQHVGRRAVMDNQAKIPRLSADVDAYLPVLGVERRNPAHA
jgi:hypothetical protein